MTIRSALRNIWEPNVLTYIQRSNHNALLSIIIYYEIKTTDVVTNIFV